MPKVLAKNPTAIYQIWLLPVRQSWPRSWIFWQLRARLLSLLKTSFGMTEYVPVDTDGPNGLQLQYRASLVSMTAAATGERPVFTCIRTPSRWICHGGRLRKCWCLRIGVMGGRWCRKHCMRTKESMSIWSCSSDTCNDQHPCEASPFKYSIPTNIFLRWLSRCPDAHNITCSQKCNMINFVRLFPGLSDKARCYDMGRVKNAGKESAQRSSEGSVLLTTNNFNAFAVL